MPIDEPYDAIEKQYLDESNPVLKKLLELAGKFDRGFALFNLLGAWFSPDVMMAKIQALLEQLIIDIRRHEAMLGKSFDTTDIFEAPGFAEAVVTAMDESVRTADEKKIKRYAMVLSSGMTSGPLTNWEEVAAYIRDLSRLTDADIAILRILHDSQARIFQDPSQITNPNNFTEKMPELLKAVDESKIPHDDFYARCARLNGFGLALEVQRSNRYAPGEHCFRMTGRGYELMKMLIG